MKEAANAPAKTFVAVCRVHRHAANLMSEQGNLLDEACEFAIDPALTFLLERPSYQVFALYKMTRKHLRDTQGD